ncbi:alpha/beta hydrolase [Pedobacter gandavensis]|uniref:Alpha/beta hydrolase fold domain-containing protein n=1 Tax=Pedobacter gandavensis TaxID=2679963 RepID=A0ABR6F1C3_9SPHI|nr:alpha/beta hydrolase [Pedobacter gandavensis]MBB2151337.1 alpha/beta hydrolase fold domain-containing protein [Pedobacter gandavensis]
MRFKKTLIQIGSILVFLILAIFIAFKVSPWPYAMLIRYAFNKEGIKVNEHLEKQVPNGLSEILDQQYIPQDKSAKLDVYYPSSLSGTSQVLPVIVWIHGGGWVAGSKDQMAGYCKILAAQGYSVVAIDYTLAPEGNYPLPLQQTQRALQYLMEHAKRFHIDTNRFILAGDSGGAHIAAQSANIIYNSQYAALMKIEPAIPRETLSGVMLYCGPYDTALVDMSGDFSAFLKTILWAYSGQKDLNTPAFKTASVINYVTKDFPPTFISVGNADPLLTQSLAMARKLNGLGVLVDSLFFSADHQPPLPHEYQFNLDTEAGKLALHRSVAFLEKVSKR